METVADILGDGPHVEPVATRLEAPRLDGQAEFPPEGIYFGMPEDQYHAIHACSASGIKKLSVSSMDYWANSLLNPEKAEPKSRDSGELTPMELGKAYHCYICEGVVAFEKRYAVALDRDVLAMNAKAENNPFCVTIADIRKALEEEGIKPKGTSKDALADQLLLEKPDAVIWDRQVAAHAEVHAGKTMISTKLFHRIAIANAMIVNDPQLKDAFTGGHAEVSIFWYDVKTGIPMKARLDYLKMNHLIDLKSFSNKGGKPVQRAIDMAIGYEKYFIPVVVYLQAIDAAKKLVRDSKGQCIHIGSDYDQCVGEAYSNLEQWVWDWAHQPDPEVLFVFQQTGIAPVTRGRIMPTRSTYVITLGAVEYLKAKWGRCAKTYGTAPWVDFEPVVATEDESMNWAATDFGETE